MRITEHRMIELAASSISQGRERVQRSGEELQSGVRVSRPSQDPAAWAQARRAEAARQIGAGRSEVIARSQERLALADTALGTIGDAVTRARELAVTAASDTTSPEGLAAILAEVRELRQAAVAAGNTRATDGEYIFAGSRTDQPAFAPDGTFQGDDVTRSVETADGLSQTVTLSGAALTAAGGGVDVFAQLAALETALAANDHAGIGAAMEGLRAAGLQTSSARSEGGAHSSSLITADETQRTLDDSLVALETRLIGADPIAAASELAQHSQALEAAQVVASRIIELTKP